MVMSFELFATAVSPPDALWAVVGDPGRLPEWTDAEEVRPPAERFADGQEVTVRVQGAWLQWTVLTAGERIWEANATTPQGTLGIGTRVVADHFGSRLILAGSLEPAGSRLVARALVVPRLRARFDRWAATALALARER